MPEQVSLSVGARLWTPRDPSPEPRMRCPVLRLVEARTLQPDGGCAEAPAASHHASAGRALERGGCWHSLDSAALRPHRLFHNTPRSVVNLSRVSLGRCVLGH